MSSNAYIKIQDKLCLNFSSYTVKHKTSDSFVPISEDVVDPSTA